MVKTRTHYVTDKAEGFELRFEPVEDSITVEKTDEGFTVKYLILDDNDQTNNPRENCDELGTMACFHRRYDLGDKNHGINSDDYSGWAVMEKALIKAGAYVVLPLYLFDHSGITMSVDPERFRACDSAGWDWGQVGFIFVNKDKVRKEYGKLGKKTRERVTSVLLAEVETYDMYLRGEVYCCVRETFNPDKVQIDYDTCGGYIGEKYALEALKEDM